MKKVEFSVDFVSIFKYEDKYSHIPTDVLERVCKEGLIELMRVRLDEMNKNASHIWIQFAGDPTPAEAFDHPKVDAV